MGGCPRSRDLGDVIVEDPDIFGDGVNVAARLEALAEPGGICVSRVVRDQVRDKLDVAFEDQGEQSLKNMARPVRVYRVELGEAGRDDVDSLDVPKGALGFAKRLLHRVVGTARWILARCG